MGLPACGRAATNKAGAAQNRSSTGWPAGHGSYRVIVTGFPNIRCELEFEDEKGDHAVGGVILTATRIVNAIPAVCAAAPGLLSALDLPLVTGRGLYRV